mmetsp:Transcript_16598/g.38285  ORF Transcript_16598/g.38285 Transcript_16598/m.38285 type:complete len:228 (-) Transcript_16598:80-763(-)
MTTSGVADEWESLSSADKEGMLLATEARTLGSQGEKHGNDVGAVLVVPSTDQNAVNAWRVLAWGCARSLEAQQHDEGGGAGRGGDPEGQSAKKRKKGSESKIDVHAEMDAVCYAARRGIAVEGAVAFVTRSPCNKCLPLLVAAGITRVVYSDSIGRHTSAESERRQLSVAADNGVELVEGVPCVPRELARHRDWLDGKGLRLFPRREVRNTGGHTADGTPGISGGAL